MPSRPGNRAARAGSSAHDDRAARPAPRRRHPDQLPHRRRAPGGRPAVVHLPAADARAVPVGARPAVRRRARPRCSGSLAGPARGVVGRTGAPAVCGVADRRPPVRSARRRAAERRTGAARAGPTAPVSKQPTGRPSSWPASSSSARATTACGCRCAAPSMRAACSRRRPHWRVATPSCCGANRWRAGCGRNSRPSTCAAPRVRSRPWPKPTGCTTTMPSSPHCRAWSMT